MMNEIVNTILVFAAGIVLGVIFFGGLWLTVKRIVNSKKVALWFLGSFVVRVAITLSGFYFVGGDDMKRLLVCLAGFVAARFVVLHFTKMPTAKNFQIQKEVSHDIEP